jgi:hypothetical protein
VGRAGLVESKVAVVPGLKVTRSISVRTYVLLLTDQRSIFILQKESKAGLGAVLGGAVGAYIAEAMASVRQIDPDNLDPELLAGDVKNISVPHASLQHVKLRKLGRSYKLVLKYDRPGRVSGKLSAQVIPPRAYMRRKKAEGIGGGAARHEFALKVRRAFERALPPSIAHRMEWRI